MSGRGVRVELTEAQVDVLAAAVAQAEADWEDQGDRARDIATLNRAWDRINRARREQAAETKLDPGGAATIGAPGPPYE